MSQLGDMRITSPLPQRYLTDSVGIGGRIKVHAEDFLVEEIPLYEPCGEGEHIYLFIEKTGVSHGELMGRLRRRFGVTERALGYAGMKDKHAVTRQMVSVHLLEDPPSLDIGHERIRVLSQARHRNRLRRGHLRGNRFTIRIRDVDPALVPAARRTLRRLEEVGVPCYFGSQRFGYRCNNHIMGALLLNENWDGLLAELLGATGSPFPEYQRERRELFDAGRFAESAPLWSPADRAELIAARQLRRGDSPEEAARATGRSTLNFWVSALASAVFNRVLDDRIGAGTVAQLIEGDLAWKHDSRAVFQVTAAELASGLLQKRLDSLEISPTGPLWGKRIMLAGGAEGEIEREALEAMGVSEQAATTSRYRAEGGRRPFRAPISQVSVESDSDAHGPCIRVSFELPRGIYATIVLREIMKADSSQPEQRGA